MKNIESFSHIDTYNAGYELGLISAPGSIICLCGGLGAGKTVFTKGLAEALGVDEEITSPTFGIINEYEGRLKLYHFDVYRIRSLEELEDAGYDDCFFGNGVCVIEWAEMIKMLIPSGAIWVYIEKPPESDDNHRYIRIGGDY